MYGGLKSRINKLEQQAQAEKADRITPEVRAEVETIVEEYRTKYNSEPERQKRAAEYAQIQEKSRKLHIDRG